MAKTTVPIELSSTPSIVDNGNATAITIDSSQNVGIGTGSPASSHKLTVASSIRLTGAAPAISYVETDASSQEFITGMYGGLFAIRDVTNATFPVYIETSTPTNTLRLNSTGVGIGTSSPSTVLHISTSNDPVITLEDTGFGASCTVKGSNGNLRLNSTTATHFDMGGSEIARFNSSGNLGIGTSSPLADLHISSTSNTNIMLSDSNAATDYKNWDILVDGSNFKFRLVNDANNAAYDWFTATRVGITSATASFAGNVGIGTSSPSGKLQAYVSANRYQSLTGLNADLEVVSDNNSAPVVSIKGTGSADLLNVFDNTTEVFTILDGGNVGIGTSSPAHALHVNSGTTNTVAQFQSTDSNAYIEFLDSDAGASGCFIGGAGDDFVVLPNGTEKFRVTSSGDVGIGVSPSYKLHVSGTQGSNIIRVQDTGNTVGMGLGATSTGAEINWGGVDVLKFVNVSTEQMRISSAGNLLVGTNYDALNAKQVIYATGTGSQARSLTVWNGGGSGITFVQFVSSSGSEVGSITQNGTSAVAYNTSSDYRLKENVTYDWDATTRLKQLKPARFNFISNADTTVDGFLAHEVSSIVPEAIHGEKDEVDDEGNAVYQGIDQSKLVPLLVKTIQELEARITALEGN